MKTSIKSSYRITDTTSDASLEESPATAPFYFSNPSIDVVYDMDIARRQLSRPEQYSVVLPPHVNYSSLLPLNQIDPAISLGEGNTPLISSRNLCRQLGLGSLYFKFEGANPTGSFKDRGSVIEIAKALEYRAQAIVVASTGNMAASISAYSAAVGIPCFIFVPFGTPQTKLAQTLFYGGRIIQIQGSYDDAADMAQKAAEKFNYYLAGDYSFRAEGQKSQAYEIISQMNYVCPDMVITPVGNGTNIYAIWKGFKEFYELGLISSLPKMIGVQVEGYNSIYQEWKGVAPDNSVVAPTIASAIAVKRPSDKAKVLNLISQSGGLLVTVPNSEIIPHQIELARNESLLVEPSSATVISALKQLVSHKQIPSQASIACLLTGIGLKDVHSGVDCLSDNINSAQTWPDVESIISSKIY